MRRLRCSRSRLAIFVHELSQFKRGAAVCTYRFEIFVQAATAFGNAALFKEFPEILPGRCEIPAKAFIVILKTKLQQKGSPPTAFNLFPGTAASR